MKYHIEKNTVQETLVIPLYGRKICSDHYPELFSDPESERICSMLDYDFSSKQKLMESAACSMIPSAKRTTANASDIISICPMSLTSEMRSFPHRRGR